MPLRETGADHFTFRCPMCHNTYRAREKYEPMCTGPGAFDIHEPTVMTRIAAHGRPGD
jgi:hypothetical protein